jgi:hypothetical protein
MKLRLTLKRKISLACPSCPSKTGNFLILLMPYSFSIYYSKKGEKYQKKSPGGEPPEDMIVIQVISSVTTSLTYS